MIKLHIIKAKRDNKEKYYFISDNDEYGYCHYNLNKTIQNLTLNCKGYMTNKLNLWSNYIL